MKYIEKNNEPKTFADWKASDKMYQRGNPKWKRVPTNIKEDIRNALKDEQGHICCYCEREIIVNDYHTEHIKPQTNYPQLQLDYDNLLCSCQLELEVGEPKHCGNSKGSWLDETLFISPLNPDCELKFKYTYDGYIEPNDENDIATIKTIKKLNLYLPKLNEMRKKAIEPFLDDTLDDNEFTLFVNSYLTMQSGKYNPFFTTIKYLFQ